MVGGGGGEGVDAIEDLRDVGVFGDGGGGDGAGGCAEFEVGGGVGVEGGEDGEGGDGERGGGREEVVYVGGEEGEEAVGCGGMVSGGDGCFGVMKKLWKRGIRKSRNAWFRSRCSFL